MSVETESCVLLTRPVAAVRGFLALARRDAEAGWYVYIRDVTDDRDIAPALKLTKITATFLTYIEHHQVVEEIQADIAQAAQLARDAHDQLVSSKAFEDALCEGKGLNRAAWTVYGGEWGGPERGGLEKEGEVHQPEPAINDDQDDGGWAVDICKFGDIQGSCSVR